MSAEIYHFFGVTDAPNRISELRLAAQPKLSQQSLADLVGVSKPTISDLENGKMTLTQDYMRRLARALHVLPCDLLPLSDNPDALSTEERMIIERLRAADPMQRAQVAQMINILTPPLEEQEEPQKRRA